MGDISLEKVIRRVNEGKLGFAFNDFDFSDRLLHIEIIPDDGSDKLGAEKYKEWFSSIHTEAVGDDSMEDSDSCRVIETLHINSLILAANSPFFYKLFKNGMKESQNKTDVTLKIYASEKATLIDLLNFLYGKDASATSVPDLVDLMIAADKFEVTCCMKHCVEMLLKLPMSLESALFYLELPSSVLENEIVKPLIDAAKKYFIDRYRDFTKYQEEAMKLPLSAIEVILGNISEEANISEDEVFDFILKWGRSFYPELEERRQIFTNRLIGFISFPHMRCSKLKEVLSCQDFEHEKVSKLVLKALFSKQELPWFRQIHVSKDLSIPQDCEHSGRVHSPHCVITLDLEKVALKSLALSDAISSQTFFLGGNELYLCAKRRMVQQQEHLGLFIYKINKIKAGMETCTLDFDFQVLNKLSKEFQNKSCGKDLTLDGKSGWGCPNLLGIKWAELINDNHDYFINDKLHLRAHLLLKNSKP